MNNVNIVLNIPEEYLKDRNEIEKKIKIIEVDEKISKIELVSKEIKDEIQNTYPKNTIFVKGSLFFKSDHQEKIKVLISKIRSQHGVELTKEDLINGASEFKECFIQGKKYLVSLTYENNMFNVRFKDLTKDDQTPIVKKSIYLDVAYSYYKQEIF